MHAAAMSSSAQSVAADIYTRVVEFRVLGQVEVVTDGRRLALGGPKQRTVLALLVANAGRPIAVDVLINGVYGDEAGDGARRSIQTYIYNLWSELATSSASSRLHIH